MAGLLLELFAEADDIHHCLLGIGVNVNISSRISRVKTPVTSIRPKWVMMLTGHVSRTAAREFESRFLLIEAGEYEAVREWKSLCTLERRVIIP